MRSRTTGAKITLAVAWIFATLVIPAVSAAQSSHRPPVGAAIDAPTVGVAGSAQYRWEDSNVTYRKLSRYKKSTEVALQKWAEVVTELSLVPAASDDHADITILDVKEYGDWLASALLPPGGRVYMNVLQLGKPVGDVYESDVAAHELGHALGLEHSRSPCSLMYPSVGLFARCKDKVPQGRVACGPQKVDIDALNKLYGLPAFTGEGRLTCPRSELKGQY